MRTIGEKVEIRLYDIIYNALADIRAAMEGLLEPTLKERVLGRAEVRQLFTIPKVGLIAGCYVTDGTITNVGSYSVYLTASDGTRFDYLHMSGVRVGVGDTVRRGDVMGMVDNEFGGSSTTTHLHFNIRQSVSGVGTVYVPTYMSLVRAYETLVGGGTVPPLKPHEPCAAVP